MALEYIGAITAIVAAVGAVAWTARKLSIIAKGLDNFLSDWNGEVSRPGVPGRRGVIERISNIEKEVTINGGKSIKDAVLEMRVQYAVIASKLDEVARLQHPPVQVSIHNPQSTPEIIEVRTEPNNLELDKRG